MKTTKQILRTIFYVPFFLVALVVMPLEHFAYWLEEDEV